MRTIECNVCGTPITAENDEELVSRLSEHLEGEHDEEVDEEAVRETVEAEAYEATDS
jgi:predicted small metal-binding protein